MSESNRTPYVRTALPSDAEVVVAMAAELAAAVEDPTPDLDVARFVRDGFGPDRWFECLVVEIDGEPVGFALICRGFEAHTGKRRLWLGDLYVRSRREAERGRALTDGDGRKPRARPRLRGRVLGAVASQHAGQGVL